MSDLASRLQEFVGKPYGAPRTVPDPVNVPMIRHLTDALGDRNPIYTGAEFAEASVHGGIVAPATSLQVWTMTGLAGRPADPEHPQRRLMSMLEEAGYVGVVATNCEQTYMRYLRPGDLLTVSAEVESVSGPKTTGLGEGYFVTTLETYRDQSGEIVGEMSFRILKFIPAKKAAPKRDVPPPPRDSAFFWEGVEVCELRIQRCTSCEALRHPPRPLCPRCRSLEWDYIVATGRGEIYSFVVHHRPEVPGRSHPFVVALVQLDEGTRIVGNVIDTEPGDVTIAMRVEVEFIDDERGRKVPQWRPA